VIYSSNQLLIIISLFPLVFVLFGLSVDPPAVIFRGLVAILTSRDTLLTDYIGLGGPGAAFVNAGLLTLVAIAAITFRQPRSAEHASPACSWSWGSVCSGKTSSICGSSCSGSISTQGST
jgi:hypothetical protein